MSMNRTMMLKLERSAPSTSAIPVVSGGRSLSVRGRKAWKGDGIKHKQRASGISAIRARQDASKRNRKKK